MRPGQPDDAGAARSARLEAERAAKPAPIMIGPAGRLMSRPERPFSY